MVNLGRILKLNSFHWGGKCSILLRAGVECDSTVGRYMPYRDSDNQIDLFREFMGAEARWLYDGKT